MTYSHALKSCCTAYKKRKVFLFFLKDEPCLEEIVKSNFMLVIKKKTSSHTLLHVYTYYNVTQLVFYSILAFHDNMFLFFPFTS